MSAAVAISISEAVRSQSEQTRISILNLDASTIVVTISGSRDAETRLDLPVRLRSNTGYSLRASLSSQDALAVRLFAGDVRATGLSVIAGALESVRVEEALGDSQKVDGPFLTLRDESVSIAILSGAPISKGGNFTSPDNAIEVLLKIEISPQGEAGLWSARLVISAAPNL